MANTVNYVKIRMKKARYDDIPVAETTYRGYKGKLYKGRFYFWRKPARSMPVDDDFNEDTENLDVEPDEMDDQEDEELVDTNEEGETD